MTDRLQDALVLVFVGVVFIPAGLILGGLSPTECSASGVNTLSILAAGIAGCGVCSLLTGTYFAVKAGR